MNNIEIMNAKKLLDELNKKFYSLAPKLQGIKGIRLDASLELRAKRLF